MDAVTSTPRETAACERVARAVIFILWAALAGYLAWHHVFWRDEVRALSLALAGDGWGAMLRGIHGEGHPALWYILLRAAHDVIPVKQVLPAVAALIGISAAALLAARAPFRPWLIALILAGAFCLFEYTVSARNYGLSMLVLFAIADRLARRRDSSVVLGLLLAVLCNTNVHSVFLAGGVLLFCGIELVGEDGWRWSPRWRGFAVSAGLAAVGAGLCFATVYPPVNDAAAMAYGGGIPTAMIAAVLMAPAASFADLLPAEFGHGPLSAAALAIMVLGSPLGLIRAPGAWLSSLALLAVMALFLGLVYPGGYRHQALYVVYLITMYWLARSGRGGAWPVQWHAALVQPERVGRALFACLLAMQLLNSVPHLVAATRGPPESRVRDLAAVLRARHLDRAILVSDPDVMLEAVPYYADNPTYLLRGVRFGQVVPFSSAARGGLSLGKMLARMRALHAHTGRPVVALLQLALVRGAPVVRSEGYLGTFSTTPGMVRSFEAATTRIAAFGPAVSDESYEVYLLR